MGKNFTWATNFADEEIVCTYSNTTSVVGVEIDTGIYINHSSQSHLSNILSITRNRD